MGMYFSQEGQEEEEISQLWSHSPVKSSGALEY